MDNWCFFCFKEKDNNNLQLVFEEVFLLICLGLFSLSEIQAGAKLSLNRQFMDERWSKHRVVTCLDWSPQVDNFL